MPRTSLLRPIALSLMALALGGAQAGTVTVVTSFPKDLTDAYKKAFEAANPTTRIEVLNKNTTASIAYIKELPAGQRPDVMWASAPDAFEVLSRDKLLTAAQLPMISSSCVQPLSQPSPCSIVSTVRCVVPEREGDEIATWPKYSGLARSLHSLGTGSLLAAR